MSSDFVCNLAIKNIFSLWRESLQPVVNNGSHDNAAMKVSFEITSSNFQTLDC